MTATETATNTVWQVARQGVRLANQPDQPLPPPTISAIRGPAGDLRLTLAFVGQGRDASADVIGEIDRVVMNAQAVHNDERAKLLKIASVADLEASKLAAEIPAMESAARVCLLSGGDNVDEAEGKVTAARTRVESLRQRAQTARTAAKEREKAAEQAASRTRSAAVREAYAAALNRREEALAKLAQEAADTLTEVSTAEMLCQRLNLALQAH
jgi:hypothetical protein